MDIAKECITAIEDLIEKAHLKKGDIVVVGCSTSEVLGSKIGTNSSPDTAKILFESIYNVLNEKGIYLAAQCCEHLNRAVVIERAVAAKYGFEEVNVIPQPHAGGAFAVEAFSKFNDPIVVESIEAKADAGIDIGGIFIRLWFHSDWSIRISVRP